MRRAEHTPPHALERLERVLLKCDAYALAIEKYLEASDAGLLDPAAAAREFRALLEPPPAEPKGPGS